MGLFLSFPRLLILSGVWGYSAIYGHHDVATIFTCMQILSNLKLAGIPRVLESGLFLLVLASAADSHSMVRLGDCAVV